MPLMITQWGGPAPPAVAYVYAEGRSMADLASQVQGCKGILQVDGYGSYKGLARRHPHAPTRVLPPLQPYARRNAGRRAALTSLIVKSLYGSHSPPFAA